MPDSLYFIALLPPPPLQETIRALQREVADRFQSQAAFKSPPHLTLIPPLKLPTDTTLRPLLHQLSQDVAPFTIALANFAVFAPRVLYIHVESSTALQTLHTLVNDRLEQESGLAEALHQGRKHAFIPHITLGFRDLSPLNFRLAWQEFQQRTFQAHFMAEALTLLQHNGHQWEAIAAYPLTGSLAPSPEPS
ncbi:MAG: 2'-5' RNA ligase family protein [Prochlorotrichaceae cyanobacterium]